MITKTHHNKRKITLNIVPKTPNLITAQTTENISNDSPTVPLKTNQVHKIVTNKENSKRTKIKNVSETQIFNDKDPPLQQKEKNISNYKTTISLKTDNFDENHGTHKIVATLNEENNKVVSIENVTDIKMYKDKDPTQKDNEEKLDTFTEMPNLSTDISIGNASTSQLTFSVNTDHFNETLYANNKLRTNINLEDNKLTKIQIVSETNSCNDSSLSQKQIKKDGKLNITTKIPNRFIGKSVKNLSNSQPPISLKTDNINEIQHVKNKMVTNLNKEVSKIIEIKNISEIKNSSDLDPSLNHQIEKEEKLNISIPYFSTSESAVNVPDCQSNRPNISIIKDHLKNKITTDVNKDKNKIIEIENINETKECDYKDQPKQKEMEDNSVKSKLFSMLDSKVRK